MFASLAVPNYRIYFSGTIMTNMGQWMARTAQSWLVLMILTNGNAAVLGWLMAVNFAPMFIITPWAGALADRVSKRRIMVTAQIILAIDATILSTLVLTGAVQLWMVFVISAIDGTASAFYSPATQAFVSELVPQKNLPNAVSLNSASFNGARLLGPGLGGLLIAAVGVGWVMAINVVCFIGFITTLLLLKAERLYTSPRPAEKTRVRDGLRYVKRRPDLVILLTIGFMMGTFGVNFNISDAVMATQAFGKGPGEYGLLGSLMGVGSMTAALGAARRKPRLRWVELAMLVYAVSMTISALAPNYGVFAVFKIFVGWGTISTLITANAMVQTSVTPQMRGRVMSLWATLVMGGTPFVSPIVGWIGNVIGPRATVAFGAISLGITFVVITAVIMHNDKIRVVFDPSKRAPWLRQVRGKVTIDYVQQTK
ncbi:MFS transporter [Cutibacterium sp.]|uniref:MFS transporter n=1 Tax=Cutibacterium sp. TaxID=1912221 RepID=UPI0026DAB9E3|nr:MFS transporter [Cutibacterium sp.]MDO4412201.1 MFS transporter [Cutibacterium sp.]